MRSLLLVGCVSLFACSEPTKPAPPPAPSGWTPGTVMLSEGELRGQRDVRGIIHAHSVYSHDACDGEPRDETTGAINESCFDEFRADMCKTGHEFIMLSDHGDSFARTEFPEVLLYRDDRGDQLVERGGGPVANRAACGDGRTVMLMAGSETETMPVGLEGHVVEGEEARVAIYDARTAEAVSQFKAKGAVALVAHTEGWTVDELVDLGVDGFEMYNLHANTILGAGGVFSLLSKESEPELLPHADLVFLPIVSEDPRYLETWGEVLSRGVKRVSVMGTDCHRNTFAQKLPDGERIDSYRRMMSWFSNHLLVKPEADGSWDDSHLKEALRAGRLYGVFEVMGYAEGFDYFARSDGQIHEMGQELSLAAGVELEVTAPRVRDLDPDALQPELSVRLLRAIAGGWEVVAERAGDLAVELATTGAYRAEVRMRPRHLAPYLSSYAALAEEEFVWIYANAIYVAP